jgi:hypothetical protein
MWWVEKRLLIESQEHCILLQCLVLSSLVCRVGQGSLVISTFYCGCAVPWCCDLPGTNCRLVRAHKSLIGLWFRYLTTVERQKQPSADVQGQGQTLCLINYHHNWVIGGNSIQSLQYKRTWLFNGLLRPATEEWKVKSLLTWKFVQHSFSTTFVIPELFSWTTNLNILVSQLAFSQYTAELSGEKQIPTRFAWAED